MRKGTVVNLKGYKFFEFLAKNNILIILVAVFILGNIIGTFSVKCLDSLSDYSTLYLKKFISERTDTSFLTVMLSSLMSSLLVLILTFVSGASMLGVILVPLVAACRGVLYGGVTAVLYSTYSIKGVAFNAVMMIPSAIVFIISLLLASRESVRFSLVIAKMTLPKTLPANLYIDFKNYCGRYLILSLIALFSSIVDGVLSCSFMQYFKL